MNEQIKLEEIVGYLPYRLKYIYKGKIAELVNLHYFYSHDEDGNITGKSECTRVICSRFNEKQSLITAIKPILRNLSDLTKEIEVNGEKFVPIDFIEEKYYTQKWVEQLNSCIQDSRWINHCEYALIQFLYQWHFDIHNLIERGLAVDINTLEK